MRKKFLNELNKICEKYSPESINCNSIAYITDEPVDLDLFFRKDWGEILSLEKFSDDFLEFLIEKHPRLNTILPAITRYQTLSEFFIEKHIDKIKWQPLLMTQNFSEDFLERHIEDFKYTVMWNQICSCQKLSENFMEKYCDKLNWAMISQHQKLSESFIEKYQSKLEWSKLSLFQTFSSSFVDKFSDKINFNNLRYNQNDVMGIKSYLY